MTALVGPLSFGAIVGLGLIGPWFIKRVWILVVLAAATIGVFFLANHFWARHLKGYDQLAALPMLAVGYAGLLAIVVRVGWLFYNGGSEEAPSPKIVVLVIVAFAVLAVIFLASV